MGSAPGAREVFIASVRCRCRGTEKHLNGGGQCLVGLGAGSGGKEWKRVARARRGIGSR